MMAMDRSERFEKLSSTKQALFEKRIQRALDGEKKVGGIQPRNWGEFVLLSFAQQSQWFLNQLEPQSPAYNRPVALHLRGELALQALEQALVEILRRHEVLRERFVLSADQLIGQVTPMQTLDLPVVDLGQYSPEEREAAAQRLAREASQRPYNLSEDPIVRPSLLRLAQDDHVLLLIFHHIAFDAWSAGVFVQELALLYAAFRQGRPSPLANLPIQYADYAAWQKERLQGPILEEQLAYWERQLADLPPALELPMAGRRLGDPTRRGGIYNFSIPERTIRSLKVLGRAEEATLFMVLLAAFQTLLYRLTGQTDLVLGTPVAGRLQAEAESLIGLFINTLALRMDLSGAPTFRELLERVKDMTLEAFTHQELPFDKIVQALNPVRVAGQTPVFQILFNMEDLPEWPSASADLSIEPFEFETRITQFDLILEFEARPDGLAGAIVYSTDLFDAQTIGRMCGYYLTLLEGCTVAPDRPIDRLLLSTESERRQLTLTLNNKRLDRISQACVHQLIEAQVEKTPLAPALIFQDRCWTYAELNRRANQLAHLLRQLGVGPDVLVRIFMDRSPEMFIAILGVIKAGGAYLPLDPDLPPSWLEYLAQDAGLKIVLTQEYWLAHLPDVECHVICLDRDDPVLDAQSRENPLNVTHPDNLLCTIYTSGSTGTPKGVLIPHRGIVNYLQFFVQEYGLDQETRALLVTNFNYDASMRTIFGPWLVGGALVVTTNPGAKDPHELATAILVHKVNSILAIVPAMLRAMVDDMLQQGIFCHTMRLVLLGGETLYWSDIEKARQVFGVNALLVNQYGPSECSMIAIYYPVQERQSKVERVPVGRPVWNTRLYVLDAYLNPVPVGVPGEIYIGGMPVTRGYLNRPGLSASVFLPDPFSLQEGDRMYRTGDIGIYLPDGMVEFVGRKDAQVKMRGMRVELWEIESLLLKHREIKHAVVVTIKEEGDGSLIPSTETATRLAAYIVLVEGASVTASELRAFLAKRLPEYLVPLDWVFLNELPLTPTGKVDRRRLPSPRRERTDFRGYVPPCDPLEQKLCQIWEDVLSVRPVGRLDNFFNLGGHSLLAIRLLTQLEQTFGQRLPLVALLQSQTLAEQAGLLRQVDVTPNISQSIPNKLNDSPAPLSFSQEGLWFLQQMDKNGSIYNISNVLRLYGELNVKALDESLQRIIQRHDILRTRFVIMDGTPKQLVADELGLRLSLLDLKKLPEGQREKEMQRLVKAERNKPFDLEAGPLMRMVLYRLSESEHVLAVFLHHTVFDEWSQDVMYKELSLFYRQAVKGDPASLPQLPVQYADFAEWQRDWLHGKEMERQLAYWLDKLAQAPEALNLPVDHPRLPLQSYRGSMCRRLIPLDLVEKLKRSSRESRVTLFTTLLAAFQVLLYRYSGQADLLVGTPIANRRWAEVENLIGYFLNTLVVRADFHANPGFRQFVKQVHITLMEAFDHQDLPFERLVAEMQPQRGLDRHPLFQVMFVLHASPLAKPDLVGLEVQPLSLNYGRTIFDLSLTLTPTPDGLDAWLEYSNDLFNVDTIDRMLGHYERLLDGITADADCPVGQLPLLAENECVRKLVDWNRTQADFPDDICIHQLFEAQAERHPEAIALFDEDRQTTYGELNEQSNRLAAYLQTLGVGPEVCVGVCMRRSIELVVSMLGILKAGGVYVPLDPALPLERQAFILENGQIEILLSQKQYAGDLEALQAQIVNLDGEWYYFDREASEPFGGGLSSKNLAYMIYTSGSSGEPKGVMISHRALVNHLTWMWKYFDLGGYDRGIQITSLSFDVSVCEILVPLICGGGLVIADSDIPRDIDHLIDVMDQRQVTIIQLSPYLLQGLVQHPRLLVCSSLRHVICGGEELPPDLPARFYEGCDARLYNLYGPTECTIDALHWPVSQQSEYPVMPVGSPIANVQAYILDNFFQLVPIGIPGELYLGGEGLGRGYVNSPELTAERFVPNPFSQEPGKRLYRTGDLASYLPDGGIIFLGRMDKQVKLRGFRIELGEIEAALRNHPGVDQTVADLDQESLDGKRLVAYVVPRTDKMCEASDLRAYLKTRLPEYMIPAAFVFLETLPLTDSGKIDRKALPIPERSPTVHTGDYIQPHSPIERVVADIWAAVLNVDRIDMNDNFFDLGGHSLLAIRLTARLKDTFQMDFPVRMVFEARTMAEYCQMMLDQALDRGRVERISQLMVELANISDDEAGRLLQKKTHSEEEPL
jgi:amino acid adenylation domain-containing protein